MIVCSNCSSENESDAKFCKNCGNSLIIHSNIVEIKKIGDGSKVLDLQSCQSRRERARAMALKTINKNNPVTTTKETKEFAVHIGENIH